MGLRLQEYLSYDEDTGNFTWNTSIGRVKNGEIAGSKNDGGYIIISLFGVKYRAHRLAFFFKTGKFIPDEYQIDHKNQNKSDNRFCNLRVASRGQNNMNRFASKKNITNIKNVYNRNGKYAVIFRLKSKNYYIGTYEDIELAELVASEWRILNHKEFAIDHAGLKRKEGVE